MAGATHDDGFHEIQLNGKQLVFLFMAVTVVSVVIFLCGVLVGRGVRIERGLADGTAVQAAAEPAPPPPVETTSTGSAPTTPREDTSFATKLQSAAPAAEKLQPVAEAPTPRSEPVAEPPPPSPAPAPASKETRAAPRGVAAAAPEKKADPPPNPALAEPQGPGVAVQVSAFRVRSEAEALANRLLGKGYAAYVVAPAPGAPALFRVRVGKFKEQREADRIAMKLKKEEQFDPWIVR
jgi:cell division septation protein DedD